MLSVFKSVYVVSQSMDGIVIIHSFCNGVYLLCSECVPMSLNSVSHMNFSVSMAFHMRPYHSH